MKNTLIKKREKRICLFVKTYTFITGLDRNLSSLVSHDLEMCIYIYIYIYIYMHIYDVIYIIYTQYIYEMCEIYIYMIYIIYNKGTVLVMTEMEWGKYFI